MFLIQRHPHRQLLNYLLHLLVYQVDLLKYKLTSRTGGKFFSITFVKADGSTRKMVCRLGVKKHNGGKASDEFNYSLLTVYDVHKRGFRNINLETVQQYTVAGRTFKQEWMQSQ